MTDTIFLAATEKCVKVHPVVTFSVLDHYVRRVEGQRRVIGTLLGTVTAGVVEVISCFPVPHMEKDEEVAVGKDFNRQMLKLQRKVNPAATVVGWYATTVDGSPITEHSALIHEFYGTECQEPVHLVIDASLAENTIGIKAFVSRPLAVANRNLANQFQQVPAQMESMEAEAIALDTMARGQEGKWFDQGSDGLSTLSTDTETLHRSMKRLLEMLETTSDHVDQVVAGKITPDNEVGREIAATLAAVPRVRPEVFDRVFNDSLQDLLMTTYLSNLTRTQLAIASKLKEVLN